MDLEKHRRFAIGSLFGVLSLTYLLLISTFTLIGRMDPPPSSKLSLIFTFVNDVLSSGAHVVISCIFLFILINTKVRYRQLNYVLRYGYIVI